MENPYQIKTSSVVEQATRGMSKTALKTLIERLRQWRFVDDSALLRLAKDQRLSDIYNQAEREWALYEEQREASNGATAMEKHALFFASQDTFSRWMRLMDRADQLWKKTP